MCPERYYLTCDLLEASLLYIVAQCPTLLFAASPSHSAGPHFPWEDCKPLEMPPLWMQAP